MKSSTVDRMFLASAVFNWIVAAALFFAPNRFLALFHVTPPTEQTLWVQLCAGLILMFGVGYFWAARDFWANVQIVRLGAIAKCAVVLIALLNVITGDVSWQFLIPASGDAVFALLFIQALNTRRVPGRLRGKELYSRADGAVSGRRQRKCPMMTRR